MLQTHLLALNYNLGSYGADGEYGSYTANAVKSVQEKYGLTITGNADLTTIAIIQALVNGADPNALPEPIQRVVIYGGDCHIRVEPNKESESVDVALNGATFESSGEYDDEDAWVGIVYMGKARWVSAKYAEIVGKETAVTDDEVKAEPPETPREYADPNALPDTDEPDTEVPLIEDNKKGILVVTGATVNIRKKPSSTSKIWKTVKRGKEYDYSGETVNGFHGVLNNGTLGWVSAQWSKILTVSFSTPIFAEPSQNRSSRSYLSQHNALKNAKNDWGLLAKNVNFVILRAG